MFSVTAAFLACKVEEFNVSIEQFMANINGNKERATEVILNTELLLMQELKFHLSVHNPYRPVEGIILDIKTRFVGAMGVDPDSLRPIIDEFLTDIHFTNASLVYAPSQIALAAVIHAASEVGQSLDDYVTGILFNGDTNRLRTIIEAVKSNVEN